MKKSKKLQVKAEKETIRRAMILAISNELKSLSGIHQVNSAKLDKAIDKGAKKLVKNLVKNIKIKLAAEPIEETPPVIKENVAKAKKAAVKETAE